MPQGVTVDFNANIARFTSSVDKITNDLNKFQSNAERVSKNVRHALELIGVGLSVRELVEFVQGATDAAEQLGNMATAAHLSIMEMSGLKVAAKETGTDLGTISMQIERLTVNMGKNASQFAKMGIDAKSPIEAFKQLADVLVGIKDPQERAAVAAAAMGRGWKDAAPLLLLGGDAIGKLIDKGASLSSNMQEMVVLSKEFSDSEVELTASLEDLRNKALIPLLPELKLTAEYITDASEAAKNGTQGFSVLSTVFQSLAVLTSNFAFTWKTLGMDISNVVEDIHILATGGTIQDVKNMNQMFSEAIAKNRAELEKFNHDLLNPPTTKAIEAPTGKPTAQSAIANFIGSAGIKEASALAKKALDNYNKLLEDASKYEVKILGDYVKTLDYFYGENLVSINDYYTARNAASDSSTTRIVNNYQKEIAALTAFAARTDITELDREAAQGKINDLIAKENELLADTASARQSNTLQEQRAYKDLQTAVDNLNVQYLKMNNQLDEAAAKEFDLSNLQLKQRLEVEGNVKALEELAAVRARMIEQASTTSEAGFARGLRDYVNMTRDAGKQMADLVTNSFKSMEDALVEFVQTGSTDFKKLADSIIADMIRIAIQQSITGPLAMFASTAFGPGSNALGPVNATGTPMTYAATGGIFDGMGISRYSSQVIARPTVFPLARGAGLMGEAGPEAVMPLARDSSGRLGVRGQGGGVTINDNSVYHIDSRADRAQIQQDMEKIAQQKNAELVDKLQRQRRL